MSVSRQINRRINRGSTNIPAMGSSDVIVKKMTLSSQHIGTGAGIIVPLNTTIDTTLVQSTPFAEFASFAARYQQYRVRSLRLKACASQKATTLNNYGCAVYISDFIGASVPASAAQVLSDEGSIQVNSSSDFTFVATWNKNPNARLWTPTSAAISTANSYGIAFAGDTSATLGAGTTVWSYTLEAEVELRGSQ